MADADAVYRERNRHQLARTKAVLEHRRLGHVLYEGSDGNLRCNTCRIDLGDDDQ